MRKELTYFFMEAMPVYPETVSKGMIHNFPNDAMLCETDNGRVAFVSQEKKQEWLDKHRGELDI